MIRFAMRSDLPNLQLLLKKSSRDWTADMLSDCFHDNYFRWMIDHADVLAGFIIIKNNVDHWEIMQLVIDPDYAKITPGKTVLCYPGELFTMHKDDIHSVVNPAEGISVSLHIYGKHFNHTNRKKFDPVANTVQPFIVKQN